MKLSQIFLFKDLNEQEIRQIQSGNCMKKMNFEKNELIYRMGEKVNATGIVLSGNVIIENIDLWGNRSVLSKIGEGQIFAETYAICQKTMMVDVVCSENAEILFIDLSMILNPKNTNNTWYLKVLKNLLTISAQKNLALSSRIFCTSSKNVRTRVFAYLSEQSFKANSMKFSIPFNRQQMADYLNLDRSALSKELCRMRDEGILDFRKNQFILYKTE